MVTQAPILPPGRKTGPSEAVIPTVGLPANLPAAGVEHSRESRLAGAVVPQNETVLTGGIVIPSKKDLATAPIEDLRAVYKTSLEALTRLVSENSDRLPNLGFSGGAGQNIEQMMRDQSGRDGATWAAGLRGKK